MYHLGTCLLLPSFLLVSFGTVKPEAYRSVVHIVMVSCFKVLF